MSLERKIEKALRDAGVVIGYESPSNFMAYCIKGHDNKTPSLSIEKSTGRFLCFGCGIKGSWQRLSKLLNIDFNAQDGPDQFAILSTTLEKILTKEVSNQEISIPWNVEPWRGSWRFVRETLLKKVGALKWFDDLDERDFCNRILFPIKIDGSLVGWTARRLDKTPKLKWRHSKGFKSRQYLFPYDIVANMNTDTVILVEGPHDSLRLVDHGLPALCTFGSMSWSEHKKTMLLSLDIKNVILASDGDEGGEKHRRTIAESIGDSCIVKHFYLEDGKDPGSMRKRDYTRLKKMFLKLN